MDLRQLAITHSEDLQPESSEAPAPAQTGKLHRNMLALAEYCIEIDQTQTAADILAFLLRQSDADPLTRERAEDRFAELESRVCPRLILDAREFAADMDWQGMCEYLLDVVPSKRI